MSAKIAEYKKKLVSDLKDLMNKYSVVAVVDMQNLPSPQLQVIRKKLRSSAHMLMAKKRLIRLAIEDVSKTKEGFKELENNLSGMPALLFTNQNPFKLYSVIAANKSPALAKPGQIAPNDITIRAGPTSFAPGPIISELASVGIKTGVVNGKLEIKADVVIVHEGEEIKPKVSEVLGRLGITPMEIGINLKACYENGFIYTKDVLSVPQSLYLSNIALANNSAMGLAIEIGYITKETVEKMIATAYKNSKHLSVTQGFLTMETKDIILAKAENEMLSLKSHIKFE